MEDSHIINDLFNCAPVFTSSEASEQGRQPVSVFPDELRFFLIMDDLVEQGLDGFRFDRLQSI